MVLDAVDLPIVQAPMAGGPSTPALAAAVAEAGGLGFVAAGYLGVDAVREHVGQTRALTRRPFGVNVFAPSGAAADREVVAAYADRLGPEAERAGVVLGTPRFDDDGFAAKLDLLEELRPAVVSFAFGCPPAEALARLRGVGVETWVTVTTVDEAHAATAAGADVLVVQGAEAGGHRGAFADEAERVDLGLLPLLQLVTAAGVDVPLVATGAIATGAAVAAVLAAGARAAAIGTAFLRCPEAATSPAHRAAVATDAPTGLTRAFSGRLARGIVNRLQAEHSAHAPIAYPEIHHVTAPLRAQARRTGDAGAINLWAGEAHQLAAERPAAEIVAELAADARRAAERLAGLLPAQETG